MEEITLNLTREPDHHLIPDTYIVNLVYELGAGSHYRLFLQAVSVAALDPSMVSLLVAEDPSEVPYENSQVNLDDNNRRFYIFLHPKNMAVPRSADLMFLYQAYLLLPLPFWLVFYGISGGEK